MDGFEFISSLVSSLVWPSVIALVIMRFSKPLHDLLSRIVGLELWGTKATFSEALRDAEQTAQKIAPTDDAGRSEVALQSNDPFLDLAERYPDAAVLESFKKVESEIGLVAKQINWTSRLRHRDIVTEVFEFMSDGNDMLSLYSKIVKTRNAAVHPSDIKISPAEAIVYRDLCYKFITVLREAAERRETFLQARRDEVHAARTSGD